MDLDGAAFGQAVLPFLKENPRFGYDVLFGEGNGSIRAFRLSVQLAKFGDDGHLVRCAKRIRWELIYF